MKKIAIRFSTVLIVILAALAVSDNRKAEKGAPDSEQVGAAGPRGTVLPVNQVIIPAGWQVPLPGLRPLALALSPDEKLLAVSGKTSEVVLIDPGSGRIRQRLFLPALKNDPSPLEAPPTAAQVPDSKGQLSFTGLIFSARGDHLYLSNVRGDIKVFHVGPDGQVAPWRAIPLPSADAPRRAEEIPAGLALSADNRRLFVCGNLSNRLLELEAATGAVIRLFDVGVAPYDVVLAAGKAYVSN
jgi:DNA-binding beta-propeller fold protein YncE